MTFQSNPSGLLIGVADSSTAAPFTRTFIVGSNVSISAPSPQVLGPVGYQWASWSDGGAQSHNVVAGPTAATYTATFTAGSAPAGLVAAYGFNEGTGTTAADSSGNGRSGTLTGATWSASGKFGGAVQFDGVNDWVTVADAAALDFSSAFTVEAWVNSSDATGYRTVALKESTNGLAYALYAHDTGPNPGGYINVGGLDVGVGSGTPVTPNTWTHVALTYDGTTMRLYKDAVQAGSRGEAGTLISTTGALRFGGNGPWGEWFAGRLDEIRLYNRALSVTEIQTDMSTPVSNPGPDTTAPSVAVSSPTGGLVAGTVTVTASASDNVGVASVQFQRDGVDIGAADTTAPFSVSWDSRTTPDGSHVLTAVARDAAGNATTSAGVTVNVDNTAPAVAVTSPTGGTVSGSVTVTASATDLVGVASVQFRVDGIDVGAADTAAPYSVAWATTTASNGSHVLTAVARDTAGNATTSAGVTVTVSNGAPPSDTTPPTVAVTSPTGGTVSGTITVTATAADNVGVTRVQFKLDGANLGAADTAAPYSVSWTTTGSANGPHVVTAVAEDAAGNATTSAAVNVTVSNTAVSGLVAAYGFNEGLGTTAVDASGNGRTGTLTGTTWTASGRFGAAAVFDGVNDWVTVADAAALDFSSAFTVEAWVNSSDATGYRTVALKESTNGLAYGLYAHDSGPNPGGYIRIGAADVGVGSSAAVAANTWTHLALTYDGATIRLYKDGVQVGTRTQTGSLPNTTGPLRFGGNAPWGEWFAGRLDEIRLYSRALSVTEIQTDMSTPVSSPGPDTTAPSVAVSSPTGGLVAGTVTVTAIASDNVGVASVQFQRDGVDIGAADTTAPFSVSWDSRTTPDGSHVLTAVARDAAGNATTSAGVTVNVDNTAPAVAVTSPTGGTVSGSVTVTASATDLVGVASVQFRVDGIDVGAADTAAPYSVAWATTTASNGSHVLTAVARDTAGNATTSAGVTVTVSNGAPPSDTTPPTVAVTSPTGGTVSGTITVTATAADNVGVTRVQFKLDGANLGAADTAAPYSVSWTTTGSANGPHVVTAVAEDAAGNATTSAAVNVTVSNTAVSGLVAAYGFNEGLGTTAVDASGNGRTGTLTGTTWTASGRFGAAAVFDGVNDWVTVADAAALDFSSAFTVEAWVFSGSATGYRTVALKESTNGLAYALYAHDSGPNPGGYIRIGAADVGVGSSAAVAANTWTHLALTYDGATIRLYKDGVQVGTRTQTGSLPNTTGPLRFGGNAPWGEWFAGRLDEIRLDNRALSVTEIQTDMNTPVGNP